MTWALAGSGVLMMLVMGTVIASTPGPVGRSALGACLLLCNMAALPACLWRARQRPEEARAWRLLALSFIFAFVFNILFTLRTEHLTHLDLGDALMVLLQLSAATAQALGYLSLPLDACQPHVRRIHLLGALMFGSSLALLMWLLGAWQATGPLQHPDQVLLLAVSLRIALAGGIVIYLLAEDPRRLRGPLGWILSSILVGGGSAILALRPLALNPGIAVSPFAALALMNPLGLILAALHPASADPAEAGPPRASAFLDTLLYLPYLAAAACLLVAIAGPARHLLVPMIGFLAVTSLLVAHQFALLREVRSSRDHLEERVQERTRALEETQALMLRTERMNGLALLGAGLAHDLNNALTAIHSSIYLMRESLKRNEAVEETDLARIETAAERSASLSQRLMAFARKEAEVEERQDLARFLQEDRELLRMLLPARIRLELEIAPRAYSITVARAKLQQALVNLVANARDAIGTSGFVRITLTHDTSADGRDCASLEVSDSGSGMPPDVLEKLFQPLFTTKEPGKGTGLGLASVKAIVEGLGGSMQVRSAPGEGTTFTLRLPLEA